ncbi:MAG: DUF1553 domain-containing protein [Verrucomicrobia bacterium]|nr:DUF1553 domain-containing protein [Verrucomicrobiota bacterium]
MVALAVAGHVQAKESIIILPAQFKLSGAAAQQTLLVEQFRDNRYVGQVTNDLTFSSSDTNVVSVKDDVALPVRNGVATIRVRAGGQTVLAQVTVENMEKPFEWSFRNHVQPVLAKAGCSAGACHGAAAGQNGFKLSLRGFDDEGDFLALTHQALGRRIVPSDPGRSLMLLKPTGAVPHKGGKRFEVGSLDYRVLSEWIAAGTPGPKPDEARIDHIEILPEHVFLSPGVNQKLSVRAWFSDGRSEDVTHWVKYSSANASVCDVDETGNVKVIGFGEGAITGWYLSRIAIATVTAPYTNRIANKVFAKAARRNFIDELVLEKLRSLSLPPSPRCSDSEFIRRAFLDTIGILPSAQETRRFLADKSSKKRDALIESLSRRPEFVDYWTYKWSDLLLVSSKQLRPAAMWSYYNWIRNNVAANTPWDKFARELITAQGSTLENGAGNFYVLHDDPRAMAETTTQAFLGMSINCAKCHNHPMEKWTNKQYYQMANLFARVRAKSGVADGDNFIFAANSGDLVQPLTGRPQPPAPLDGKPLGLDDPNDRRVALADWLTSRDNPYFSRAIANRIWANFMGVGLVEKVDDLRVTNPASNEKLLSALARHLADRKFDLKSLMRAILQSEAYQRSSIALPENAADARFYSRYYPRRLMAEVALDAISQVTDVPTQFTVDRRNQKQEGEKYPFGFRALQLPDTQTDSFFLKSFGRPDREKTCECERTAEPSVTQVLHLSNGDTINQKLEAKQNRIARLLANHTPLAGIIEEAYLSTVSRFPTDAEKTRIATIIADAEVSNPRTGVEDLYWAILSSKEFLFNH